MTILNAKAKTQGLGLRQFKNGLSLFFDPHSDHAKELVKAFSKAEEDSNDYQNDA